MTFTISLDNKYLNKISTTTNSGTYGKTMTDKKYDITISEDETKYSSREIKDKIGILIDMIRYCDIEAKNIIIRKVD